jgi:hypothetical protein
MPTCEEVMAMLKRRMIALGALLAVAALSGSLGPPAPVEAATTQTQDWSTYRNERYGFQLAYPGGLFLQKETPRPENGALWTTADGAARLIATAAANEAAGTLASYREFVMAETYADARFDYAPVKATWFVLSGQKGDMIFYERIDFVCQGRFIYGWQLNYPASQRRKFDLIVEAIHRSYKVGRGEGGSCGP